MVSPLKSGIEGGECRTRSLTCFMDDIMESARASTCFSSPQMRPRQHPILRTRRTIRAGYEPSTGGVVSPFLWRQPRNKEGPLVIRVVVIARVG